MQQYTELYNTVLQVVIHNITLSYRARGTCGVLLNILVFNTDSFVYIQIHLLFRALHRT